MAFEIHDALRHLVEAGGSDLHLKVPAPPTMRVDGSMRPFEGAERLSQDDTEGAVMAMLTDERKRGEFREDNEVDQALRRLGEPGA